MRRWPGTWRLQRTDSAASLSTAVAQFALTGTAAVVVLGFVAVQVLQHTGQQEAIRDAKQETRLAGQGIVAPAMSAGLFAGRSAAIARMDAAVRRYVLRAPVVRIKIWDPGGRILYSDQHRLIGSRYALGAAEREALLTGRADADVSDLGKPENRFERPRGKLLEVYLGIRGAGRRVLFEDYLTYSSIASSGHRLWLAFAPGLIIILALLELTQIPLAWSLARRIRRGQAERETLLRRSIEASELERRRIARDLHDGAVQNLAGVSYSLAAAADAIEAGERDLAVGTVRAAAGETRQSIRELRTLLVDIYPPNLRRAGLAAALTDLVAALPGNGLVTELDMNPDLDVPAEAEPLLYRAAQEALRNVVTHSQASRARVAVRRENRRVVLTVEDDGRGFDPESAAQGDARKHFGLRILHDLARDAEGELRVDSEPGGGTHVTIEVPT